MEEVFVSNYDRRPILLREDFCGTGFLSATWVKEKSDRRAVGYDLDVPTVEWGLTHNVAPLTEEEQSRIELKIADVLEAPLDPIDIVCAMNFSWWIFKQKEQLLNYFRSVRKSLQDEGVFVLDIYGGSEAYIEVEEEHDKEMDGKDFLYVWDQDKVCGITDELLCHIHFKFKDGSSMKKAFTYDWRRYGMRETLICFLMPDLARSTSTGKAPRKTETATASSPRRPTLKTLKRGLPIWSPLPDHPRG